MPRLRVATLTNHESSDLTGRWNFEITAGQFPLSKAHKVDWFMHLSQIEPQNKLPRNPKRRFSGTIRKTLGLDHVSKAWFKFVHGSSLVYNTCWEDPRLDHVALEISEKDNILVITSAGCNALDYALANPNHVYTVDVNPKQNALLDLKLAAIKHLEYDDFFQLFGKGSHPKFKQFYQDKLRAELPEASRKFWDGRSKFFSGKGQRPSFYFYGSSGMFAWLINIYIDRVKKIRPVINELLAAETVEAQKDIYQRYRLRETMWTPFLKWAMKRDTTLALLGVPRAQRKQLDRDYPGGILQFVVDSIETVFTELPIKDNYFWRVYLTGQYTKDCCPNYLTEEGFKKLKGGLVNKVSTHTNTLLGFLKENPVTISRYVLLDHMDWLAEVKPKILEAEWQAMIDRAAPQTRLQWRSAGLSVGFVDPISVKIGNTTKKLGEMFEYNQTLANQLHPIDRVHTYGSYYIANFDKTKHS